MRVRFQVRPRRMESLRCAYCLDDLSPDAPACPRCRVVVHVECLPEIRRCPSVGCRSAPGRKRIRIPGPQPSWGLVGAFLLVAAIPAVALVVPQRLAGRTVRSTGAPEPREHREHRVVSFDAPRAAPIHDAARLHQEWLTTGDAAMRRALLRASWPGIPPRDLINAEIEAIATTEPRRGAEPPFLHELHGTSAQMLPSEVVEWLGRPACVAAKGRLLILTYNDPRACAEFRFDAATLALVAVDLDHTLPR